MPAIENPALQQFAAQIQIELVIAQVLITRRGAGYELRHVENKLESPTALRELKCQDARSLAQSTEAGEFRPLKSAPTLKSGWRMVAANIEELETALNGLYPGAVADWHAALNPHPPVTHYRDYTNRQTGMYRITTMLDDAQAAAVIRSICAPASCLKRRLWTVPGCEPDTAVEKSLIPCLEPCAVLMEAARKAVRDHQQATAVKTPE